ncbi:hypothetical protein SUGI_0789140 [Cryptomeria japonica]|nr:hypothetical protein SUGI_0789140 [Cryptomeria japonica]
MIPQWPGKDVGMYILCLMVLLVISILKEYMSLHHPHHITWGEGKGINWVAAAFTHSLHMALGYLCMLTVMSYNLGVFIVVLMGSALGFYIFHRLAIDDEAGDPESKG